VKQALQKPFYLPAVIQRIIYNMPIFLENKRKKTN